MGKGIAFKSYGASAAITPPGNVLGISVSGVIDPVSGVITLQVSVTPPSGGGTFNGCHLYLECPDQSSNPDFTLGNSALGGTDAVTGPWVPIDLGLQPYVPGQPWTLTCPAPPSIDPTANTPCRLYASPYNGAIDNPLVRAGQPGATPSQTFTLTSLASNAPNAGTNVTTLTGGDGNFIGIAATTLPPVNVTGKLETPVQVMITDTPANVSGWVARLVLVIGNADPTNQANWQVIPGYITQAGPVYAAPGDGIPAPHAFALDTPTAMTTASLWLQAGLMDASGNYQWNNIVVGITPTCSFTYGSTTGTSDATAVMLATLAASMAVVNGLFGVAPAGVTNSLLGPAAVATLNIQGLAVTNPLLASLAVASGNLIDGSVVTAKMAAGAVDNTALAALAVQANNMAASSVTAANGALASAAVVAASLAGSSVTATAIATAAVGSAAIASAAVGTAAIANASITSALIAGLAVGTAAIQYSAITNGLIANLAVGTGQMQSLCVTNAQLGYGSIANANLGSAVVASGNIANLAVGTAHIQALAVTGAQIANATITDANISTCSISKLMAGTATFTGTVSLIYSGASLVLGSASVTLKGASSNSQIVLDNGGNAVFTGTSGFTTTINGNSITSNTISCPVGSISASLFNATGGYNFNSVTVVGARRTGPGAPSGFADAVAQSWCQSLYNALAAAGGGHGLIV